MTMTTLTLQLQMEVNAGTTSTSEQVRNKPYCIQFVQRWPENSSSGFLFLLSNTYTFSPTILGGQRG